MEVTEVVRERHYKAGYVVKDEKWLTHLEDKPKGHTQLMKRMAYNLKGEWIGTSVRAHVLIVQRGIMPEKRDPAHCVCSIGYCKKQRKWYGWSHRAIFGFAIGSKIKMGSLGYQPANKEDFMESCIRFWDEEHHVNTYCIECKNDEGVSGVNVTWTYDNKVKNKKIRGTIGGVFEEYPKKWGRGEWTAKTLEDAKLMAIDFAECVS